MLNSESFDALECKSQLSESTNYDFSESSDESDDEFENADVPIYNGSRISIAENIAIFTLVTRFSITGVLLSQILLLIELHCSTPNNCIKTLHKFMKFFSKIEIPLVLHVYCYFCYSKVVDNYCETCEQNEKNNYFI